MRTNTRSFLLVQLLFLVFSSAGLAQFYKLETDRLRLVYLSKGHEYLVPHVTRCFHNAYSFHNDVLHYDSNEKITVLLQEFSDFAVGGAGSVPNNFVVVGIAPFSYTYETQTANERMNMIMNHELAHIATMDKPSPADNFYRSLFLGKVTAIPEHPVSIFYSYLTSPRWSAPRWYIEGIAVFMETWMSGGLGRALGAYDEMVFRTMVRDLSYFYDIVGLESEGTKVDFQVGANSYLYGTRFMSYLANKYGPDKLLQWTTRTPDSKAFFSSQFKKTYGVSLDDEWSSWIEWEHSWQEANLEAIFANPITPSRPITRRALGSVSRTFYDAESRKVYSAIRYPGQVAHIAAISIDTGKIDKVCDIKGAALFYVTSLAYDPSTDDLYYTTDNNGWRDLNAVNIKTGDRRTLIKDVRTGDLAFNRADKSLWGVRHFNGISTLVRIPHPYKEWNQIYSFEYGKDLFDIDVSPDGKHITGALAEVDGSQRLIKMEVERLLSRKPTNGSETSDGQLYEILFDFEISTPANFIFTTDGRYLYGSSYYSGVSNVYRYDFEGEEMEIITNCETGFFRPTPISDDSLLVFRYESKGFVPATISIDPPENVAAIKYLGNEIPKKYETVKDWKVDPPSSVDLDAMTIERGRYNTLSNLKLNSGYPIVEGYKEFAAVGMRFDFADHLGVSGFDFTGSYTPDGGLPSEERLHLGFNFHHWNWTISATYNAGDFYDLFGPTKTSRKGYSVGLEYKKNLIFDEPKTMDLNFSVTGYGDLERLPSFQNVFAPFDKLLSGSISLNYEFLRRSLGAVDYEKGIKTQLVTSSNFVNSELFPRVRADFDYGVALPLHHSSVWLRSSLGYSIGERDNPFANFFFGGFGNNYVDHLTEKRYRESYSFPGVELNEFGGKNFAKAMLEWNLPPVRFRRFGFPAFYFNWARLALFGSVIQTNLDGDKASSELQQFGFKRTLTNVGGQLDFRIVLFSHMQSIISFGYATAIEEGDLSDEFMVSLKIL